MVILTIESSLGARTRRFGSGMSKPEARYTDSMVYNPFFQPSYGLGVSFSPDALQLISGSTDRRNPPSSSLLSTFHDNRRPFQMTESHLKINLPSYLPAALPMALSLRIINIARLCLYGPQALVGDKYTHPSDSYPPIHRHNSFCPLQMMQPYLGTYRMGNRTTKPLPVTTFISPEAWPWPIIWLPGSPLISTQVCRLRRRLFYPLRGRRLGEVHHHYRSPEFQWIRL